MQTKERRILILLVIVTIIVRGGVLFAQRDRLNEDLDGYRGIAIQLANGNGYSQPNTNQPTAFRPPLYPLLLAAIFRVQAGNLGIVVLHLLMGVATVILTWRLGNRLGLSKGGLVAAGIIALDPLLIQYATFPMTETLCTLLAVLALNWLVPFPTTKFKQFVLGVVLGLCVLSRPTFLVFAGFALLIVSWQAWRQQRFKQLPWVLPLGVLLVVSPWMVRNAVTIGNPRVTTTHGGYTLLLGNNPVFYREVVLQPWGGVWDGESLAQWQESLETEMREAVPPVETEEERDRWMYQRALRIIRDNPGVFLRACGLRFLRFWNVLPPETALEAVAKIWERGCTSLGLKSWRAATKTITRIVAGGVALFYGMLILSFAVGLVRLRREEWSRWWPLVLMVACFCAVHLVYWSNTRMRAPVMPAIVLLAVRAWSRTPNEKDIKSTHS